VTVPDVQLTTGYGDTPWVFRKQQGLERAHTSVGGNELLSHRVNVYARHDGSAQQLATQAARSAAWTCRMLRPANATPGDAARELHAPANTGPTRDSAAQSVADMVVAMLMS